MTAWAFIMAGLGAVYFAGGIGAATAVIRAGVRRQERRRRAAEDAFVAEAMAGVDAEIVELGS